MRVKVTGYYEPDDDEVDEESPTGLTEEAHEELMDRFMNLEDIEVERE